jgi:hypothetical protein
MFTGAEIAAAGNALCESELLGNADSTPSEACILQMITTKASATVTIDAETIARHFLEMTVIRDLPFRLQ